MNAVNMDDPEREFAALCVDTSIFDRHAIALEKGLLKQLEQFSNGSAALLVPDVILGELRKHLTKRIQDAATSVNRALKETANELLVSEASIAAARKLLLPNSEFDQIAGQRLDDFFDRCRAVLLGSDDIKASTLLEMYFDAEPPFEASGAKKAEFPDAVALLALVSWAQSKNANVLAVSADKGWADFAKDSDCISVVDDLAEALAQFQGHNFGEGFVERLAEALNTRASKNFESEITRVLDEQIELADVDAEADSTFYAEEQYVQATYDSHEYVRDRGGLPDIQLVRTTGREIVVQVNVVGKCEITASYDLSIRDPIDRDYVTLGAAKVSARQTFDGEVLLTLRGDFAGDIEAIEIVDAEVEFQIPTTDFGEVGFEPEEERN